MSLDLDHALDHARTAARAAGAVIHRHFRSALAVEQKEDGSPVTIADREAERVIRTHLAAAFPDHAFYGEEEGATPGHAGAEYVWLIDPLDGTKGFVRGYPMFSTQIALMQRGALVLGVSYASEFDELFYARHGGGAWCEGRRLQIADTARLMDAQLSVGNLKTLSRGPGWRVLAELVQTCQRVRGYGDFYHYHRLAEGGLDLVLESDVHILDIAALTVIVREAGGRITALDGSEIGLCTTSVLAGVPVLHAAVLAKLEAAA